MKTFEQQNYPCTIQVIYGDFGGPYYHDEIKGLNPGHALWRAIENWPNFDFIAMESDKNFEDYEVTE
jgi:hypothetical protein